MTYVDGMVAAVPNANKEAYVAHARKFAEIARKHGATKVMESWGEDVPDGKQTDFKRAVAARPEETVVFSFIAWPDKQTRDAAWDRIMKDNSMNPADMPFDGKRMIYGGFESVVEE